MRGWAWVGGVLVVLVGATLTAGLVGAPRGTAPEVAARPDVVRRAARVPRTAIGAGVVAAVRRQSPDGPEVATPWLERLQREGRDLVGGDLAVEIERQRSAMRAAVVLLVAGEDTRARIR